MPVKVNPLLLQELFFEILDDLQYVQETLYSDDLSKVMNKQCEVKRKEYEKRLRKIMN